MRRIVNLILAVIPEVQGPVGDTEFLIDEQMDKCRFQEENERVLQLGLQPAKGRPLLLGITKASLSTDSFISAASFQRRPPGS